MIESVSHITFVVKDLEKSAALFRELFDAQEVYNSMDKTHSLFRECFFLIGGQWIALMEDSNTLAKTYHHIAFKISEDDISIYLDKIRTFGLEVKPPRERIPGEGYSIYFYDCDNNLFELHTGTLAQRLLSYQKADS